MKDERKGHAAKLLNKLQYPLQLNMLSFFSNEKNFSLERIVNSQNNRCTDSNEKQTPS